MKKGQIEKEKEDIKKRITDMITFLNELNDQEELKQQDKIDNIIKESEERQEMISKDIKMFKDQIIEVEKAESLEELAILLVNHCTKVAERINLIRKNEN